MVEGATALGFDSDQISNINATLGCATGLNVSSIVWLAMFALVETNFDPYPGNRHSRR